MKTLPLILAAVVMGCAEDTVTITPEPEQQTSSTMALGFSLPMDEMANWVDTLSRAARPDTFHVTVAPPVADLTWAHGAITRNGRIVTVTSTTNGLYVHGITILSDRTPTFSSWQNQNHEWMTCDETIAVMTREVDSQVPPYDCWTRARNVRSRGWGSSMSARVDCGRYASRVGHVRMYVVFERWRQRSVVPRHDGTSYGRWGSGYVLVC